MLKKTITAALIMLLIGGSGCMNRQQRNIDRIIACMNDKYTGDTFEFAGIYGGFAGAKNVNIIVRSEKYPKGEIHVFSELQNGILVCSDTYLGIRFEEETRNYLVRRFSACFGSNLYLSYHPDDTACTYGGSSETTFEEYISERSSNVTFSAMVISEESNEAVLQERVEEILSETAAGGWIYFIPDSCELRGDSGRRTAAERIRSGNYSKKLYFVKKNTDSFLKAEWENGR